MESKVQKEKIKNLEFKVKKYEVDPEDVARNQKLRNVNNSFRVFKQINFTKYVVFFLDNL